MPTKGKSWRMKAVSKGELKRVLAKLMVNAKHNRDFSETDTERARWSTVVSWCGEALDHPSIADLDELLGGGSEGQGSRPALPEGGDERQPAGGDVAPADRAGG